MQCGCLINPPHSLCPCFAINKYKNKKQKTQKQKHCGCSINPYKPQTQNTNTKRKTQTQSKTRHKNIKKHKIILCIVVVRSILLTAWPCFAINKHKSKRDKKHTNDTGRKDPKMQCGCLISNPENRCFR